ncbi:MAG: hypothetical protein ACSI46_28990 [Gloeotrichia echinulata DVL01]
MTYLSELNGKKLAVMDSLIAATAHHHKLTLVTRNLDDFKLTPVKIMNSYRKFGSKAPSF